MHYDFRYQVYHCIDCQLHTYFHSLTYTIIYSLTHSFTHLHSHLLTCTFTRSLTNSQIGREWGAATTEGLQVFGLDDELIFAPEDLSVEATPQAVYTAIKNKNHGLAVTLALQLSLSEFKVLEAAIESTPMNNIEIVVKTIHPNRFKDLFKFLTQQIVSY